MEHSRAQITAIRLISRVRGISCYTAITNNDFLNVVAATVLTILAIPISYAEESESPPEKMEATTKVSCPDSGYPKIALYLQIEGVVDIEFSVSDEGETSDIRVVSATPPLIFNKAAIASVKCWKFPKGRPGKNVPSRLRFELEK